MYFCLNNLKGIEAESDFNETENCGLTEYGCCDDGITMAKGLFKEGCIDNSCAVCFLILIT